MRVILASTTLLALVGAVLVSADLVVQDGKFDLLDSVGIAASSADFSSSSPKPLRDIVLSPADTLRITFTVLDKDKPDESIVPQQTFLSFKPTDPVERVQYGRDFILPLKVRKGGKTKVEIDMSRAPVDLLALSSKPIAVFLLIGDGRYPKPISIPLATITLSPSLVMPFPQPGPETLPTSYEVERHQKMPEIQWNFSKPEKKVGIFKAGLGFLLVLSPWLALLGVVGVLSPTLRSPSLHTLSFLLSFSSLELYIIYYWVNLKLLPAIPYLVGLSLITALTGRNAMGDVRRARLAGDKKAE